MSAIQRASLYFNNLASGGTSDKVYYLFVKPQGQGFVVNYQHGRRGGTMQGGTKTKVPVPLEQATKIYQRVYSEKVHEGYQPSDGAEPTEAPLELVGNAGAAERTPFPPESLQEIVVNSVPTFMDRDEYWLQLKADGEYRQIEKLKDGTYVGYNKLGTRRTLPSEIIYELKKIKAKAFFIVGEQIGTQLLAHTLYTLNGKDLTNTGYESRYNKLEKLVVPTGSRHVVMIATWKTKKEKEEGLKALQEHKYEGGVFVLKTAIYRPGESRQHKKYKFWKSLSAIVTALGHKGHNSATLSLIDPATEKVIEVGRCSLNGKPPVKLYDVVEIEYLYAGAGKRLVQPNLAKIRNDVRLSECTMKQLIFKQGIVAS